MKRLFLIFILLFFTSNVYAQIPTFHQFYGEVKNNGNLISGTYTLTAKIDGEVHGTGQIVNGLYGYSSVFFVENGANGKKIEFYIGETLVGDYNFENEATTKKDFNYNVSVVQIPASDGAAGGAGGESFSCTENWQCKEWSKCNGKTKTRICIDLNHCSSQSEKIEISQCEDEDVKSSAFHQNGEKEKFSENRLLVAVIFILIFLVIVTATLLIILARR
jgi:hypothetical protein